ncbi:MAG: hypothetical protein DRR06_18075 [Gammaproteobacteria bacterium]|nr:MAG: hypothetical protein DRR06_18075 [Gammaproteobacteria bacterium]
MIASALHYGSSRSAGPFIKVNCGAIPIELVDSELFGHEKGSFTGAIQQKLGRFERADGGTLFLDEIGELSPQAQVRLLRTLQNREIERVGGTRAIPVNVRIICATNRNLQQMIAEGEFREDLWFRLNVFPIAVPPLRQRKEDIPSLASYFIEKKSAELRFHTLPELDSSSLQQLVGYNWPGNVRELENVIERALIIHQASPSTNQSAFVRFDALPLQNHDAPLVQHNNITRLKDFLADQFHKTLALTEGKIYGPGGAAEILNIHPDTLRHKMKRAGVHYGRNRNTGEE